MIYPSIFRLRILFLCALLLAGYLLGAQDHHFRQASIDVRHYRFGIDLNDSSDVIRGNAVVEITFLKDKERFCLDLVSPGEEGRGMAVRKVTCGDEAIPFRHRGDSLCLEVPDVLPGDTRSFRVVYEGVPEDGLVISRNKFGDRTFFGDNWPNRARHWLPAVDHPSDKATVEFLVEAPSGYRVISNGIPVEERITSGRIFSHWKTRVPIPTKVMVIGVSPFAVQYLENRAGIPLSSWVYPQNREKGFRDYSVAVGALEFLTEYLGPFPYAKLANVQSRTRYGGMENAGCIFYHERTVDGKADRHQLFAHEIAHQWFGDDVTEGDWHHIWLSEGFATYLADLYLEHAFGREAMVRSLMEEREQVTRYAQRRMAPVVDTALPVSVQLLNRNSYEKGAWVLHMLRRELGDEAFRESLRSFYASHARGNALTCDFRQVVDSVSGKDFGPFFQQWIHSPGHPVLEADWEQTGRTLGLEIRQHQPLFTLAFPLDIRIRMKDGSEMITTLTISNPVTSTAIPVPGKVRSVKLDPGTWLLFEPYSP